MFSPTCLFLLTCSRADPNSSGFAADIVGFIAHAHDNVRQSSSVELEPENIRDDRPSVVPRPVVDSADFEEHRSGRQQKPVTVIRLEFKDGACQDGKGTGGDHLWEYPEAQSGKICQHDVQSPSMSTSPGTGLPTQVALRSVEPISLSRKRRKLDRHNPGVSKEERPAEPILSHSAFQQPGKHEVDDQHALQLRPEARAYRGILLMRSNIPVSLDSTNPEYSNKSDQRIDSPPSHTQVGVERFSKCDPTVSMPQKESLEACISESMKVAPATLANEPASESLSSRPVDAASADEIPSMKPMSRILKDDLSSRSTRTADRLETHGSQVLLTRVTRKLILIINYRGRTLLRRKIHGFFSSENTPVATETPSSIVSRPSSPPKPVHPFFMGRLGQPVKSALTKVDLHPSMDVKLSISSTNTSDYGSDSSTVAPAHYSSPAEKKRGRSGRPLVAREIFHSQARSSSHHSSRPTGGLIPPWPAQDMVHVRGLSAIDGYEQLFRPSPLAGRDEPQFYRAKRKQKDRLVRISDEDNLLNRFADKLAQTSKPSISSEPKIDVETEILVPHPPKELRLPSRLLLTGSELQKLVNKELLALLPVDETQIANAITLDRQARQSDSGSVPPALLSTYQLVENSRSAFSMACCETQQWVSKYAPKKARECLQSGQEVLALSDWLRNLTLDSGGGLSVQSHPDVEQIVYKKLWSDARPRKRLRTKARQTQGDDLSDFIVASEDESEEVDELTELNPESSRPPNQRSLVRVNISNLPRDLHRVKRPLNVILLSGPCGCGKSAAAYAVAKELGFEIFEINAGSRRSGQDLLEKVGDVSRNHLVHRSKSNRPDLSFNNVESADVADVPSSNSMSGKNNLIKSFLERPHTQARSLDGAKRSQPSMLQADSGTVMKQSERQLRKDSLILLEEVDVLFEEDKQFWTTVLALLWESKRPVIMTCNDESLVPLETLSLHGILRFKPPPAPLAVNYLLLVAAAEGHLLRRAAVEALYASKRHDLRASIMELNLWCQMAIGDRKGGLDWMDYDQLPQCSEQGTTDLLRVVSKDSYLAGMGWSNRDSLVSEVDNSWAVEEILLSDAWNGWGIDIEEWNRCSQDTPVMWKENTQEPGSMSVTLAVLQAYDNFYHDLSSADVFAGRALASDCQVHILSPYAHIYTSLCTK